MNKMIKNIFVTTALTVTFAPALHCKNQEKQAFVSKGKLQSAIDYVKNMRKPLTAQEKLAQHIAQADVAGFKTAYDAFMQSDVTPAERTAITQELTANAQAVKQQLQTALDTMGDAQTNKTMLAKGLVQGVASGILLTTGACTAVAIHKLITVWNGFENEAIQLREAINGLEDDEKAFNDWVDGWLCNKIARAAPFKYSFNARNSILEKIFGEDAYKNDQASIALHIIPAIIEMTLGYYGLKSGIQNCKNGWNYKAYLQQQIKNIDEISEYIKAKQQ